LRKLPIIKPKGKAAMASAAGDRPVSKSINYSQLGPSL
jgi:hypothetical protein